MPSTAIQLYAYDEGTRQLTVTFITGRIYVYENVPRELYADFRAATSKGEFFNRRIRDRFAFRELV